MTPTQYCEWSLSDYFPWVQFWGNSVSANLHRGPDQNNAISEAYAWRYRDLKCVGKIKYDALTGVCALSLLLNPNVHKPIVYCCRCCCCALHFILGWPGRPSIRFPCFFCCSCQYHVSRCVEPNTTILFLTPKVLVTTIDAQWEGMGDVGSARYDPAPLSSCPTIRVSSYSS